MKLIGQIKLKDGLRNSSILSINSYRFYRQYTMKHFRLAGYLFFIGIISAQLAVRINNLQKRDGFYYQPRDSKPYTGKVIDVNENGDIILEGRFARGMRNGIWITRYGNGQKEHEGYYKNGIKIDLWRSEEHTSELQSQ